MDRLLNGPPGAPVPQLLCKVTKYLLFESGRGQLIQKDVEPLMDNDSVLSSIHVFKGLLCSLQYKVTCGLRFNQL